MTLGELIATYLAEKGNTMTDFSRESGISRAYAYMLMKNKNNDGGQITPSMDTVKKVAKGIHIPFDAVVQMLDDDTKIHIEGKKTRELSDGDTELLAAFHAAPENIQQAVRLLLEL